MKTLAIAITLLATMVSCSDSVVYRYEAKDRKGRDIRIFYTDYGSKFIHNPFNVGDNVHLSSLGFILDCERCDIKFYDATITKIK